MPDKPTPRRRWYQFRLSTWFVLVAILAWAITSIDYHHRVGNVSNHSLVKAWRILLIRESNFKVYSHEWRIEIRPIGFFYLSLALAVFVGWKAAWLIVERRRKKPTDSLS